MDWQQLSGVLGQQMPAQPAAAAGDPTSSLAAATTGAAAQPEAQAQLANLYYQQLLQSQQLQAQQQGLGTVPGVNQPLQANPMQAQQSPAVDATALQQLYALQLQQAMASQGLPQQNAALLQQQLLAAAAAGGLRGAMPGAGPSLDKFSRSSASTGGVGEVYLGDIVDYDEQKGFGFIECADTQKLYGIDIFLLRSALDGAVVNPGDKVNFQVEKGGPKGPKAANVQVVQRIEDREDLPVFFGLVKRYDENRGLGFIDCAETKELYGKDILVFKSQLGELGKRNGAKLSFSIIKDARGVKAAKVKILADFPPGIDHKMIDATKITPKIAGDDGSMRALTPPADWKPDWQKASPAAKLQQPVPVPKVMVRPRVGSMTPAIGTLTPSVIPPRARSRSPKPAMAALTLGAALAQGSESWVSGSDSWAAGSDSWAAGSDSWTAPSSGTGSDWQTW